MVQRPIFALVCAVLVGSGAILALSPSARPPEAVHHSPPRNVSATGKSQVLAHLLPATPAADEAARLDAALASLANRFHELRDLTYRRVLASGHELEANVELLIEVNGNGDANARLIYDSVQSAGEKVTYRALARGGALHAFRADSPGEALDALPEPVGDAPPISLGDVRIEDVFALAHGLAQGKQRWLGRLDRENARPLWVAELRLSGPGARSGDTPSDPTRAAFAVITVDAERLDLRSVRIFDADAQLHRVYDGFALECDHLRARAQGLAAGSHTELRVHLAKSAAAR